MVARDHSDFYRFNPLCHCLDRSLLATMVWVARASRGQNAISHRIHVSIHRALFV